MNKMESTFWQIRFIGVFCNLATAIYIKKSYDIRTHVFALIFSDAVLSTFGNALFVTNSVLGETGKISI